MIKEIESRRSIRRYKDIPVKEELIEEILKSRHAGSFLQKPAAMAFYRNNRLCKGTGP